MLGSTAARLHTAAIALGVLLIFSIAPTAAVAAPGAGTGSTSVSAPRSPEPDSANEAIAGGDFACALAPDGLECWGDDASGQSTPPSGTFVTAAAGGDFACAIVRDDDTTDGGPIECWGNPELGRTAPPVATDFDQIEAAATYTCARHHSDWTLECWGPGAPVPSSGDQFASFSVFAEHYCGILSGGSLRCFGHDFYGEVGGPNSAGGLWDAVSAGLNHTCAIRDSYRTIQCWGSNSSGQLDAPAGEFQSIASTDSASCAISTTWEISCWGWNVSAPAGTFQKIDAGSYDYCAISTDAFVWCSGSLWASMRTWLPSGTIGVSYDAPLVEKHVSPTPTWQITSGELPAGLTITAGRVTGSPTEAGSYPVTIRSTGSVLGFEHSYVMVVNPGAPASVGVTVSGGALTQGDSRPVVVRAYDVAGNDLGVLAPGDYSLASSVAGDTFSDDSSVSFGFDLASAVTLDAVHTITATYGALNGSVDVTVAPLVRSIELTLDPGSLVVNSTATATVVGLDVEGEPVGDLTSHASLSSSIVGDAISGNQITTASVGMRTIEAAYGTLESTAGLVATVGPLASVTVAPSAPSADEGESVAIEVEGFDAFGNSLGDVTASASLTSSVSRDAIAGNEVSFVFDPAAIVTTDSVHTITAAIGDVSSAADVSVAPLIRSIRLTTTSTSATAGDTIEVTAAGLDSNGDSIADVSDFVVVTSDQDDTITGNRVTFTHASPHRITADYGTLSASIVVEVSARPAELGRTGMELTALPLGIIVLATGIAIVAGLSVRRRVVER